MYPFVEELEYTIQGASSRPPPCPFEAWDRIGRAQNVLVQYACNATTGGGRHRHHRDGGSRWCRSRPFSWTDVACQLPTTQHAHSGGCCARGGSAAVGNGQWARAGEAGSRPSARLPECLLRLLLRSASRHPWGGLPGGGWGGYFRTGRVVCFAVWLLWLGPAAHDMDSSGDDLSGWR